MQNRYKNKTLSPTSSPNKKKSCNVHTNTDAYVCEKCAEREKLNYTESEEFRTSYLKSINYINCCHSLMNELLYKKTGKATVTIPDMPNFMDVLTALQKDSFKEKGVATEEESTNVQAINEEVKQDSNPSDDDMDRYAQELLLASTETTKNKPQCFNQTFKTANIPQGFCTLPQTLCGNPRQNHLTNLNLLKQQNDDDASDTDYIPSDNETDEQQHKTTIPISHPLKLNQRSLHLLDEKAMSKIGLFTENGELHHDAIRILEAERIHRAKDVRNKQFRRRRVSSENVIERRRAASSGSADLSDIKSESELEANQECGVKGLKNKKA